MTRSWILALSGIGMWAVEPVAFAEARCRIEPTAAALQRLEVWGKEWAGTQGAVAAHSSRHVAWVADRNGTVLEALFLVTLHTGNLTHPSGHNHRPQWVHCSGGPMDTSLRLILLQEQRPLNQGSGTASDPCLCYGLTMLTGKSESPVILSNQHLSGK